MQIQRMTASFGRLAGESLTLGAGLNLLQAPNESGKSTWCAFLRTMLYGLSTRERGTLADKNRYAPWTGAPMAGQLQLLWQGQAITLSRDTQRATAPMGRFTATYTGTHEPVPRLTAKDCGETLLGISRSVWERSAFIGQAALSVEQTPELERRITALVSTGEEGSSYSEIRERLRKQLTRRRHNQTGRLPQLERELTELEDKLRRLREAQARCADARQAAQEAEQRLQSAQSAEQAQQAQAQALAEEKLHQAQAQARQYELELQQLTQCLQGYPSAEQLLTLQAGIQSLTPLEGEVSTAQALWESAQAEEPAPPEAVPAPQAAPALAWLPFFLCGTAACFTALLLFVLPKLWFLGLPPLLGLPPYFFLHRRHKRALQEAQELYDTYLAQERCYAEAQERTQAAKAQYEHCRATRDALCGNLLQEGQRFCPQLSRLSQLQAFCTEGLRLHRQQKQAEEALRQAQLRCHLAEAPVPRTPSPAVETAARQLELARERSALAQGQLHGLESADTLQAQYEQVQSTHRQVQEEYDALALALDALEEGNRLLQTRFSPALGAKTAEIFSRLTGGAWQGVTLDKELHATASTAQNPAARELGLLSQGTADQLYLALRLAICQLVLPPDVPLVLDDALVSFDDRRMELALAELRRLGQERQILLFTCQEREAAALAGAGDVHVQCFGSPDA